MLLFFFQNKLLLQSSFPYVKIKNFIEQEAEI